MKRQTGTALGAALLSGLVAAAVLILLMSAPSVAVPDGELDPTAVSAAVHDAAFTLFPAAEPGTPPPTSADGVGAFDPDTATWHLRTRGGDPTVFAFGAPGTIPLMGDWDGDGVDTVGTYDATTATVTLRNTNSAGEADVTYTVGLPGDVPIAGDFVGDGTDTVSVFRPSDGFVYVYDTSGAAIGVPAATYTPADNDGYLFAADFDGDGTDTIGSWDPATGTITVSTPAGALESEFTFASTGTRFFVGDWTGDGTETPGSFEARTATVQLRYENTDGGPDESYPWGTSSWIPVAGHFGELTSNITTNVTGAPEGLAWAVESLYLELGDAPYFGGEASGQFTSASVTEDLGVDGVAMTAEAYGGQVAVVTTDTDTILAVSDDGWTWSVVGGTLASRGFSATATAPRFVTIIGSDYSRFNGAYPDSPIEGFADSIHIYGVNPDANEGAIVGIPRDTAMPYDGQHNIDGMAEISFTMHDQGPQVTTQVIADETSLPIEGYFATGFGSSRTPFPGFQDLVDSVGGIDFLVPYSVASQCIANPPTPIAAEGDVHVNGAGALAFAMERKCIPTDPDSGNAIHSGNGVRTLGQGLLMKAAVVQVKNLGIPALPSLLDIMDDYVKTDLAYADVLTLASTIYGIDTGPMPTLTPTDIDNYGFDAYNLNPGDLPNVLVEGCDGFLDPQQTIFNQFYVSGNYGTFADFADGTLDTLPVYRYLTGIPDKAFACPWLLDSSVTRLAGSNRFATAAEISKSKFGPGTAVVYVATGRNFPDALAAGPVAALDLGPILLVEPNSIPGYTATELSRLDPGRIVIVGGTAAVSTSVETQLGKYTNGTVTRLAGNNRYATATAISKSMFSAGVPVVYIGTGQNFPDALAAGPVAATDHGPILLVEPSSIPGYTATELSRLNPGRIVIVGGTAAVSTSVETQLGKYTNGTVTRLAGNNRYATATAISKSAFPPGTTTAYVATGLNFPDALAGGPAAGYAGTATSPILLVEQNSIPGYTATELSRLQPHSIIILGGSAVVSDKVMSDLAQYTAP